VYGSTRKGEPATVVLAAADAPASPPSSRPAQPQPPDARASANPEAGSSPLRSLQMHMNAALGLSHLPLPATDARSSREDVLPAPCVTLAPLHDAPQPTMTPNLLVLARSPEHLAALGAQLHAGVPRNANRALDMAVCECVWVGWWRGVEGG